MANGKSKGRETQSCKLCKGEVLVTVYRADKKEVIPGAKVDLKGPTPGSKDTDKGGWAEFKGLTPGSYSFKVSIPKKDWVVLPYSEGLSVSANDVAIGNAKAHPTGILEVRVVDELTGAVVLRSNISSTEGPQSVSWDGPAGVHLFEKVLPGNYVVTARGDDALYDPVELAKLGKAAVPEGGKASVTIPLPPKGWIEFVVHDKVEDKDLASIGLKVRPANQAEVTQTTDGKSPCRFPLRRRPATCKVVEMSSPEDMLFEVVDVQSA